jgi:hypothetical protein
LASVTGNGFVTFGARCIVAPSDIRAAHRSNPGGSASALAGINPKRNAR